MTAFVPIITFSNLTPVFFGYNEMSGHAVTLDFKCLVYFESQHPKFNSHINASLAVSI